MLWNGVGVGKRAGGRNVNEFFYLTDLNFQNTQAHDKKHTSLSAHHPIFRTK